MGGHIRWPTATQRSEHMATVEERWGLPHVVGFIDGTHIRVMPANAKERVYSFNRKQYHSIVLQGIVDSRGRFLNVHVGYLGRVHDARVFTESPICALLANVETYSSYLPEPQVIVGDAAYPLASWLIVPYAIQASRLHETFNARLSGARMAVERAFGKLKGQWGLLRKNVSYGAKAMTLFAGACCVLHNITIDVDDERGWQPPEDSLHELFVDGDMEFTSPGGTHTPGHHIRNQRSAGQSKRDMMLVSLASHIEGGGASSP